VMRRRAIPSAYDCDDDVASIDFAITGFFESFFVSIRYGASFVEYRLISEVSDKVFKIVSHLLEIVER